MLVPSIYSRSSFPGGLSLKGEKSLLSVTGIVILVGILLFLNGVSRATFSRFYWDLTDQELYSLTDGTKKILTKLEDPITLKFYFSKTDGARYPIVRLYGSRINDLLRQYERIGKGKVKVEIYDPRPDSEEEEWAQKYGLVALPGQGGEKIFLGLAGSNSTGEVQVIPAFNLNRQEFLEYDITKLVYGLLTNKKPIVGIITTLNIQGSSPPAQLNGAVENTQPWFFTTQLAESAEVRYLEAKVSNIAKDIDVLVIIHPKGFNDPTLYAIDQYVLHGGKLVVLVDPYCEADTPAQDPQQPYNSLMADRSSNLDRLLSKWGVEMVQKKVVADIKLATTVKTPRGGEPVDFVAWLSLRKANANSSDVTSRALENLLLPWAGALKLHLPKLEAGETPLTIEPLLQSSEEAMLLDEQSVKFGGGEPEALLRNYVSGKEKQIIAARIRGILKTNFPEGKPKVPADTQTQKAGEQKDQNSSSSGEEHLAKSTSPGNIAVIADVDFLANRYSVNVQNIFGAQLASLLNDNLVFFQNVVENLFGSDDLIGMRSRGQFSQPFTRVQEIEHQAALRWQQTEAVLQAKLNAANQRLNQLQASGGSKGASQPVFSKELLTEITHFREERNEAQRQLREVRRNLRQDKERLGAKIFFFNTFFVPLLLVIGSAMLFKAKKKKRVLVSQVS